jgi:ribonuclease/clavin/mitogillin
MLNLYIPSKQILLAGDNFLSEGTAGIAIPDVDMDDYFQTLYRLRKLNLSKIGPGHGEWILNPQEHIEFVLNRRIVRNI